MKSKIDELNERIRQLESALNGNSYVAQEWRRALTWDQLSARRDELHKLQEELRVAVLAQFDEGTAQRAKAREEERQARNEERVAKLDAQRDQEFQARIEREKKIALQTYLAAGGARDSFEDVWPEIVREMTVDAVREAQRRPRYHVARLETSAEVAAGAASE